MFLNIFNALSSSDFGLIIEATLEGAEDYSEQDQGARRVQVKFQLLNSALKQIQTETKSYRCALKTMAAE